MTELEKAARKCVFDELCVWCCKRVYTHCEYISKTNNEPICKEGKVIHSKFIAGAEWQAKQYLDGILEANKDVLKQIKEKGD